MYFNHSYLNFFYTTYFYDVILDLCSFISYLIFFLFWTNFLFWTISSPLLIYQGNPSQIRITFRCPCDLIKGLYYPLGPNWSTRLKPIRLGRRRLCGGLVLSAKQAKSLAKYPELLLTYPLGDAWLPPVRGREGGY
jgi:hypothetical protein